MKQNILGWSIFLSLSLCLGSCDGGSSGSLANEGAWNASFRVASGALSEDELKQASWVSAVATRSGGVVAQAEAAFADRSLYLVIPSEGDVQLTLTGYISKEDRSVVWSGSGTLVNGITDPSKNIVTISRGSAMPAILSSLSINNGLLSPAFSPNTTTYADTVDNSVSTTYVYGNSADLSGFESYAVGTGSYSSSHPYTALTAGAVTSFHIKSTNSLGNSLVYTVNVFRKSIDSTLSSLSVNDGTLSPAFSSMRTTYTDTVENSITSTYVYGSASDPSGTESYAVGNGSYSNSHPYTALTAGAVTSFHIKSTNSLGNSLIYTVNVFRKSIDSTLSSLSINDGTLFPAFSSIRTTYTDTVENSVTSTYVYGSASDPWGTELYAVGTGSYSSSHPYVALTAGAVTSFHIKSTNSLGNSLIYTVNVFRKSIDSTLSSLSVNDGTLFPAFSSTRTTYTDTVENSVTSTYVYGSTSDPWGTELYAVGTGSYSSSHPYTALTAGVVTPFYIKSTNALGHSLIYTVKIYRKLY